MAKNRFRRRTSWKQILSLVLGALVIFGCVFGAVSLFGNTKKDIKASAFVVGGLDDQGEYIEQTNTIFTEKLIECQGLEIVPGIKSKSTYRVFLYDHNKNFMEATDELVGNYKLTNTAVRYCRIMITPSSEDGEEVEISFFDVRKYVKEFDIKVNKKQSFVVRDYFVADKADKVALQDLTYESKDGYGVSKLVSIDGVDELKIVYESAQPESMEIMFFKSADSLTEGSGTTYEFISTVETDTTSTEVTVTVPEGATHMIVNYKLGERFAIYAAD